MEDDPEETEPLTAARPKTSVDKLSTWYRWWVVAQTCISVIFMVYLGITMWGYFASNNPTIFLFFYSIVRGAHVLACCAALASAVWYRKKLSRQVSSRFTPTTVISALISIVIIVGLSVWTADHKSFVEHTGNSSSQLTPGTRTFTTYFYGVGITALILEMYFFTINLRMLIEASYFAVLTPQTTVQSHPTRLAFRVLSGVCFAFVLTYVLSTLQCIFGTKSRMPVAALGGLAAAVLIFSIAMLIMIGYAWSSAGSTRMLTRLAPSLYYFFFGIWGTVVLIWAGVNLNGAGVSMNKLPHFDSAVTPQSNWYYVQMGVIVAAAASLPLAIYVFIQIFEDLTINIAGVEGSRGSSARGRTTFHTASVVGSLLWWAAAAGLFATDWMGGLYFAQNYYMLTLVITGLGLLATLFNVGTTAGVGPWTVRADGKTWSDMHSVAKIAVIRNIAIPLFCYLWILAVLWGVYGTYDDFHKKNLALKLRDATLEISEVAIYSITVCFNAALFIIFTHLEYLFTNIGVVFVPEDPVKSD